MNSPLSELGYLSGAWQGDGFAVDFSQPSYTMMFGSMQASDPEGKTAYWETFRFEAKNQAIFVYPAQMGRENGAYLGKKQELTEGCGHRFESFIDKQAKIQQIYFHTTAPGSQLTMGVSGVTENGPFEKMWHLERRQ